MGAQLGTTIGLWINNSTITAPSTSVALGTGSVRVYVSMNAQQYTSTFQLFQFYDTPRLFGFTPYSGPSFGNT